MQATVSIMYISTYWQWYSRLHYPGIQYPGYNFLKASND